MIEISTEEKNFLVNKTVGCIIFAVFGTVGLIYSLWTSNWNFGLWNLLLDVCCTAILYFNIEYIKNGLRCRRWVFFVLKCISGLLFLGGILAGIAYIALGAIYEESFDMDGYYVAAPVAIVTSFWSIFLFLDCRKFEIYAT